MYTAEQIEAGFAQHSTEQIRAELKRDYGIVLAGQPSRTTLLARALEALNSAAPVVAAARAPEPPPPAPTGPCFEIRCYGVLTRFRAGHTWTSAWEQRFESELTPTQWSEMREDKRIMIRPVRA